MCKVDGQDGPEPWNIWPGQRRTFDAVLAHRRIIILKSRQLGETWALANIGLWWALGNPAHTILALSRGQREADLLLRRLRRLYHSLPDSVKAAFPVHRGLDSGERFEVGHPEGPASVVSLPSGGGRSETAHLLLLDEADRWEDSEERLADVLPTAADSGRIIMSSTANGMGRPFWHYWQEAPDNGWFPIFISALDRPGRDRAWVDRERARLGELGPQEYPLTPDEAFLSSGRGAFDARGIADLLRHSAASPLARVALRRTAAGLTADRLVDGPWRVWEWPRSGHAYLIAADVAGGGGGLDYSYACVYDTESWDQVAAFHGRPEPTAFADMLRWAGWFWSSEGDDGRIRPALLIPESNNHGQAIVALLREWRYPNIYRRETFNQRTQTTGPVLGWETTGKTRALMIAALQDGITEGTLGIRDREALVEMQRFIWKANDHGGGKWEAGAGANDDRVMGHAIAAAVLAHSRRSRKVEAVRTVPYRPRVSSKTGY